MNDTKDEQVKQLIDFVINYNRLSQYCFNDCISSFTNRELSEKEVECGDLCVQRFVKINQRMSKRFEEFQTIAMEKK